MDLLCTGALNYATGDNDICKGGLTVDGMNNMVTDRVLEYMDWPYAWGWGGKKGWTGDTRNSKCEPKKTQNGEKNALNETNLVT